MTGKRLENCKLESDGNTRNSSARVPYYVQASMLGVSAYLIGVHLWTWIETVGVFLGGQADFRRLYASGYMVRTGDAHLLYDRAARFVVENRIVGPGASLGFDHLSYETLLFVPFSWFPYRTAYLLFLAFNLGLLTVCFWILWPWMQNLRRVYKWLPAAMFLAFLPVCAALIQGQDSILLLMLFAMALRCLERDREFLAGLLLAIGFFKFQIVLPIAGLFLLWKRWRFAVGFAGTAGAAILGSVALVGMSQNLEYLRTLAGMSVQSGSVEERIKFMVIPTQMANIRGFVFGTLSGLLPNGWIQILTLLLSIAIFVWVAFSTRKRQCGEGLLVAMLAAGLVSYHFLMHDMVVLLIPVLVIIDRFLFAEGGSNAEDKLKLRTAALLFTAPVLMGWTPGHFYLAVIPLSLLLAILVRTESGVSQGCKLVAGGVQERAFTGSC